MADDDKVVVDFREVGATGLRRFSGFIYEEFLKELTGWKGVAVYKEMGDNEPVVGALLYAIDKICRRVSWRAEAASQQDADKEAAEFLEGCMDDMDQTWSEFIAEVLSMLLYGHSVHEIVYKRRCGDGFDPSMRSRFTDGRIGWRCLPIRSQDTLYRWQFDDHGNIQGVEQLAPPHYYHVTIPVEKMLLFRTTTHKNNPEGRSIFRNAYRPWYMKKNIENIEAIGVERDLAGLPVMHVPAALLSRGASNEQKALLSALKQVVTNVRRDEQEGLILPSDFDVNGNPLYKFELMSTAGSRQFDTDKIVSRYDHRIAICALGDFLLLGQGPNASGSWAMHSDKTKLFAMALGVFMDIVAEVINRYAVPRLMALNDFAVTEYPKIKHSAVEAVDLKELKDYVQGLSQAGMPLFPDEPLEDYLRKAANLPEIVKQDAVEGDQEVEEQVAEPKDVVEIPPNRNMMPTGLSTPADTTPVNGKPPVETVTNAPLSNPDGNTETQLRTRFYRRQTPEQFTNVGWKRW